MILVLFPPSVDVLLSAVMVPPFILMSVAFNPNALKSAGIVISAWSVGVWDVQITCFEPDVPIENDPPPVQNENVASQAILMS